MLLISTDTVTVSVGKTG